MNIAVMGVTGVVGKMMIKSLEERKIKFDQIFLFASDKSAGKEMEAFGKKNIILELTKENLDKYKIDVALWATEKEICMKYIPYLVSKGVISIDNSSAYRMDEKVPLVVPEINADDIKENDKIIANPNCSTIQAVVALNPLRKKYGLKRIVYSTYQAVSGAGQKGIDDLVDTLQGKENKKFPYPIANNCIPHIDDFIENGYTKEEMKMINETRKILHNPELKITATTVRVPVLNSHSESINVELNNDFKDKEELFKVFKDEEGIVLVDNVKENKYPIAAMATGKDEVFVGRIRRDYSRENSLNMWVVSDNVRKGAATNAVQILEYLIKKGMVK